MGTPPFDRHVFVKQKQSAPPPSRSPLPGALALLVVAALSAFATYRYFKAGGKLPGNNASAQVEKLQEKLKTMQAHVHELETKQHTQHVRHVVNNPLPKKAKLSHALPAEDAPHPHEQAVGVAHHSADPVSSPPNHSMKHATMPVAHKAKISTPEPSMAGLQTLLLARQQQSNKEMSLLQNNLAANHDEWKATANRLGDVVGQIDSQQNSIKKNETNVNYLMARARRTRVPFTLTKERRYQRVGPISMKLTATSVRNQHYNIRIIVNDKSVELKDRALNEVVQFFTSQSKYPLELIVSQIKRGEVSGVLVVPNDLSREMSNTQLQEK